MRIPGATLSLRIFRVPLSLRICRVLGVVRLFFEVAQALLARAARGETDVQDTQGGAACAGRGENDFENAQGGAACGSRD